MCPNMSKKTDWHVSLRLLVVFYLDNSSHFYCATLSNCFGMCHVPWFSFVRADNYCPDTGILIQCRPPSIQFSCDRSMCGIFHLLHPSWVYLAHNWVGNISSSSSICWKSYLPTPWGRVGASALSSPGWYCIPAHVVGYIIASFFRDVPGIGISMQLVPENFKVSLRCFSNSCFWTIVPAVGSI